MVLKQAVLLPVDKIHNAEVGKIRPLHTDTPEYQNLYRTIERVGFNSAYPILVRPLVDPVTKKPISGEYQIVNGQHRHNVCKELGLPNIPAIINDTMTDEEAAICQYQLNESVKTTIKEKHDYFKQFCAKSPNLTQAEIAEMHGISPNELSRILKFEKLIESAKTLVGDNKIPTTKALALATVPPEFQDHFLSDAQNMDTQQFVEKIQAYKKEMQIKKRRGDTSPLEDKVIAKLVPPSEAKLKLEMAKKDLEAADPDDPDYNRLIGRKQMAEEMLQVDEHTLQWKAAVKEQEKSERALAAARKKMEEQQRLIKEMEEKRAQAGSQSNHEMSLA